MKVELQRVAPAEIEARSMEIIQSELGERSFPPEILPVVKRVIHTTADFDYADNLVFSPGAVEKGVAAVKAGCVIVTDTQMARSGVNKRVLEKFGGATPADVVKRMLLAGEIADLSAVVERLSGYRRATITEVKNG